MKLIRIHCVGIDGVWHNRFFLDSPLLAAFHRWLGRHLWSTGR
jgi:hypothetical protein